MVPMEPGSIVLLVSDFEISWAWLLELEIKYNKHGGFNINYEKATVVWQGSGFES
jgi:hypothetical protein